MSIISLSEVSYRYGAHVLLDCADLNIAEGDQLALVGRNGCGKTSLLKLISGEHLPDSGLIERKNGIKTAYLPQDVPMSLNGSVYSVVASGLGEKGEIFCRYNFLLSKVDSPDFAQFQTEFDALSHRIDELSLWGLGAEISDTVKKLELDPNLELSTASAGIKRRALLGKGFVSNPDVLLLDEPTNHLDIDSVLWLEKFLKECKKTLVFVSHDRTFLRNLATRVVEVDRAKLISFDCHFDEFITRRDELLKSQERNEAAFDKKLAKEEVWLRRGIKARRTRNEGRVRELMKLRQIRSQRRSRAGVLDLKIAGAVEGGQKVFEVENVSLSFGGKKIIDDFSTTIYRGDKIGIIGRNGIGKTTLLNILLGKLKPDCGSVETGTNFKVAYFDQLRAKLNDKTSPFEFVGEGSDFVGVLGQRQNTAGYLQKFMFSPEQIYGEIGMLSGGEKNRLMLAKLFTAPANVLVLDEPTNDLDMETIEILEAALVSFDGTILLVSHDRTFLNNIVTGVFCFGENGKITELVGGYDEWEKYRAQNENLQLPQKEEKKKAAYAPKKREKFTNRERAELESIPQKIDALESELADLTQKLQSADFVKANSAKIAEINARIEQIQKEDEELFARWEFLQERKDSLENPDK